MVWFPLRRTNFLLLFLIAIPNLSASGSVTITIALRNNLKNEYSEQVNGKFAHKIFFVKSKFVTKIISIIFFKPLNE